MKQRLAAIVVLRNYSQCEKSAGFTCHVSNPLTADSRKIQV